MTETLKPVVLHANAYKSIIFYCSQHANPSIDPSAWKLVYGALSGFVTEDVVYVAEVIPLLKPYDISKDHTINREEVKVLETVKKGLATNGDNREVIGLFHTRPNSSSVPSKIDMLNQRFFQTKKPAFVGIIYDQAMMGQKYQKVINEATVVDYRTGLLAFRINDLALDQTHEEFASNYYEVDIIVDGLSKSFFAQTLLELSEMRESTSQHRDEKKRDEKGNALEKANASVASAMGKDDFKGAFKKIVELSDLAEKSKNDFYIATSLYWKATFVERTKVESNPSEKDFESALIFLQTASATFEKIGDLAGAGLCLDKMASLYQERLKETDMAKAFYSDAIKMYEASLLRPHPLRKDEWCSPQSISKRVGEIKDHIARSM